MQLFSTKYSDDKVRKFDSGVLEVEIRDAINITIISAYYSLSFLNYIFDKVLKKNRHNCRLLLILNGLGGQRLIDQKIELNKLKEDLAKKKFKNIDIRLNFESNLMHAKLYYIERASSSIWFIGSANSTNAAFNNSTGNKNNEELMIGAETGKRAINSYISNIKSKSIEINDKKHVWPAINDLISFFRTGTIFFKSNINISFTFSELKIPEHIEDKLIDSNGRPLNTSPGSAWGPYNLRRALGMSDDSDTEDNGKASIKPYSIETCYGLWVPNFYVPEVRDKIKNKSKTSKRKFLAIKNGLDQLGDDKLKADFDEYMLDVRKKLAEANIEAYEFNFDEKALRDRFEVFLRKLKEKINNDRFLDKLTDQFISAGMPEIWDDPVASHEFEESFFDYIAGNYKLNGNNSQIIKSIIDPIDIETFSDLDGDTVKDAFRNFLKNKTWKDDSNWIKSRNPKFRDRLFHGK